MRKKVRIIFSISVVLLAISLISFGVTFYLIQKNTRCPLITEVSYLPFANVNEDWQINATTDYLQNSCWRLLEPEILLNEDDLAAVITICARLNRRAVCSGTRVQLGTTVTLVFPIIGNWTVNCNNQTIYVQVI